VSIEALHARAGGHDELVDLATWEQTEIPRDELLWVDVIGPDDEELSIVQEALSLGDVTVDALRAGADRPDAFVLPDGVQVIVRTPGDELDDDPGSLQILMGAEWVVTCHEAPIAFLEEHRQRVRDEREVGLLTPVQFLAAVLDWQVDAFFRVAEQLEREVDRLDDAALRTEGDLLQRLVQMRRRIARARALLTSHREVFAELRRPDFMPDVEPGEAELLVAVAERLDRAAEAVGHAREMLIGTFDVHMTRTAQRTNDIVRVLTWASVILLPASLLAGIMGMNFRLGFFEDPNMFWAVIGFMLTVAVVTLGFARWRGWL
jgi:Mg2+ and Co2+ transporter CorA